MKIIAIITIGVACALAAAAFSLSLTLKGTLDGQIGNLQRQNASLQSQNTSLQAQINAQVQQESKDYLNMEAKLGTLSTPTDPLSAYNQICSGDQTSNSTGNTSLYYWPCTDSAETIPQPGS
jgi:hypothetical protein